MAKELVQYLAEDGKTFATLEEAEWHERICELAEELGQFTEYFPEDGYDSEAAAKWLLSNYRLERMLPRAPK